MMKYKSVGFFLILWIVFSANHAFEPTIFVSTAKNQSVCNNCVKTVDMALYQPRLTRSLRNRMGIPCECISKTNCLCCVALRTITPNFEKRVCFNVTAGRGQPIVIVDMLFNNDQMLTHILRGPIETCILYNVHQTLKLCLDFKQVQFTQQNFHFCINLQVYHNDEFTIVYFHCLDMPRL